VELHKKRQHCYEGNDDKEVSNSDEELIVATERDFKCQVWQPADHFEKLLEATYPNHTYPVRHKLKKCTMMKNYMATGTFVGGKMPEGDPTGTVKVP
jgi:hypothetical protein